MAADDRSVELEATLIVLFVLGFISVSLRLYTHGVILRQFFAERLAGACDPGEYPLPFPIPAGISRGLSPDETAASCSTVHIRL